MEGDQEKALAEIRKRVKKLLIGNLSLEGVEVEDIKDDEILFGEEGLGLDSLDAVEIVVLLQRNFGLEMKDIDQGKKIFYSVDTLTRYIYENRESNIPK